MRSIFLIWFVFCINSTIQISNLEEIKSKNFSFEVRLIYMSDEINLDAIKFVNFDDFKAIKFWNFNLTRYNFRISIMVVFIPNKQIILDLKIRNNDFKCLNKRLRPLVAFYFLKGFDVDLFSLSFNSLRTKIVHVFFFISNFILFKNQTLVDESNCIYSKFPNDFYFSNIFDLYFYHGIKYSKTLCKFIFKNSKIINVYFFSLTESFIKTNQLGFIPKENVSLNSSINFAYFNAYRIVVDQHLLDKDVFKNIKKIELRGDVTRLDKNLFKHLNNLNFIMIFILNVRNLFSRGIEWIYSMETSRISNMSDTIEILNNIKHCKIINTFDDNFKRSQNLQLPYLYPDEDFCWFKDYPLDRLIFLDPHTYCVNNCSCTQYWLLQYAFLFNISDLTLKYLKNSINSGKIFQFSDYKDQIQKCNFHERLKNCETKSYSIQIDQVSSFKQALIDSQFVDFIVVILTPIIGTFGIIVNVINIITISRIDLNVTSEEKKQKTLIRFMFAYSIINLVYCVIYSVSLISKCVDLDGIFCSSLYFTGFAQWYKIIFAEFMASNLKTFSNLIYFCISLSRYILLEKESKLSAFIQVTFIEMSRKKKTLWSIVISIILIGLNSHKIFIYKVMNYSIDNGLADTNPEYFFSLPFILSNSEVYNHEWNYLTEREVNDRSIVYEVFTYVNFVLNDVIFYLLFTLVDILLVIGFNKATEKKKNAYKDKLNDEKIQKLLTDMEQNGKNIMRVILVNTCILLVIKIFDLFMSVSKFKIWKDNLNDIDQRTKLNSFCHTVKICSVYEELVKLVYMIHYSFSIVCFYFLNKNFKINIRRTFFFNIPNKN